MTMSEIMAGMMTVMDHLNTRSLEFLEGGLLTYDEVLPLIAYSNSIFRSYVARSPYREYDAFTWLCDAERGRGARPGCLATGPTVKRASNRRDAADDAPGVVGKAFQLSLGALVKADRSPGQSTETCPMSSREVEMIYTNPEAPFFGVPDVDELGKVVTVYFNFPDDPVWIDPNHAHYRGAAAAITALTDELNAFMLDPSRVNAATHALLAMTASLSKTVNLSHGKTFGESFSDTRPKMLASTATVIDEAESEQDVCTYELVANSFDMAFAVFVDGSREGGSFFEGSFLNDPDVDELITRDAVAPDGLNTGWSRGVWRRSEFKYWARNQWVGVGQ